MRQFLIVHKVRGRATFDVAEKQCVATPPCQPECGLWNGERCKGEDVWMLSTMGHRAYPAWFAPIGAPVPEEVIRGVEDNSILAPDLPDLFRITQLQTAATKTKVAAKSTLTLEDLDL